MRIRPDMTVRMPDVAAGPVYDRDYRIFLEMHRQRRVLDAMV